jgi:hypothetical protein
VAGRRSKPHQTRGRTGPLSDTGYAGHRKRTTFIAAAARRPPHRPLVMDRAVASNVLRAYISRCPAPTLPPGDIVVMDNLAPHKVACIRRSKRPVPVWSICRPIPRPEPDRTRLRQRPRTNDAWSGTAFRRAFVTVVRPVRRPRWASSGSPTSPQCRRSFGFGRKSERRCDSSRTRIPADLLRTFEG